MRLVIVGQERIIMKFIDDKGRLFGKWNIIDFIVCVFLLSLLPMFFYVPKILQNAEEKRRQQAPPINWEQKYQEAIKEKELTISQCQQEKETIFKRHPRMRKYFK